MNKLKTPAARYIGFLNFPNLNLVFLNEFGVRKSLKRAIKAYAAMVGTPPAETRDVNATWLGMITMSNVAPKTNMTVTALRGWPSGVTWPIHLEPGRTPSRATAKMRRDAATMAMLVFYYGLSVSEMFLASYKT